MAFGLTIVAIVLAVCSVIMLLILRSDIKAEEKQNKTKKGKRK